MKYLVLLFTLVSAVVAQQEKNSPLLLRVDVETFGPFGRSHSHKCTEIYEDGRVLSSESWHGGAVDASTHKQIPALHQQYGYLQMEAVDVDELKDFVLSSSVRRLKSSYPSPYTPVDYFEKTHVDIHRNGKVEKTILLNEYGVSDLESRSKYPSPLIVLMDRIEETRTSLKYDKNDIKLSTPCEVVKPADD
jgi:hypothetical protein